MRVIRDSEILMDGLMHNFKKYLKKKSSPQQKGSDKIMKNFYKEIKNAERKKNKLFKNNNVSVNMTENKFTGLQHSNLMESKYFPIEIKTYIENNLSARLVYKFKINDRNVKFLFNLTMPRHFTELSRIEKIAHKMITWLLFISEYADHRCAKKMDVYIYLTPFKKMLPNCETDILESIHANSGITTNCANTGEICIFREEELFKVFIHETIHLLGLDFSRMSMVSFNSKLSKIYDINSEFNAYEAYTEFWATIMNSVFTSYYICENNINDFLVYLDFCIAYEEYFSMFQCVKVLRFMGLFYMNLLADDNVSSNIRKYLYREKTNIFSYYILKSVLLNNSYYFMMWCKRNNTNIINFDNTKANLQKFFVFISNHYKYQTFIKDIHSLEYDYRKLKTSNNIKNKKNLMKSMRMTIIELK